MSPDFLCVCVFVCEKNKLLEDFQGPPGNGCKAMIYKVINLAVSVLLKKKAGNLENITLS